MAEEVAKDQKEAADGPGIRFLDRTIHVLGCTWSLITTEEALEREMDRMGIKSRNRAEWPTKITRASTFCYESESGHQHAIVIKPANDGSDAFSDIGDLVHEAVHIWQNHLEIVGDERNHSKEFEAYAIQMISETLITAWSDLNGVKPDAGVTK